MEPQIGGNREVRMILSVLWFRILRIKSVVAKHHFPSKRPAINFRDYGMLIQWNRGLRVVLHKSESLESKLYVWLCLYHATKAYGRVGV